jgi:Xaa-Pro dipeptidase
VPRSRIRGLGALLCFDQNNIRYTTSTVIGEWARDKLTRYCLLTGNGDPYVWDFGSAAKHHRLHAPWLRHDHCRAGLLGLRGAVGGDGVLFREAAREIKSLLDAEGVGDMPLGIDVVEPPMMLELQKLGIEVRDGQQTMLAAREVKNIDELTLLNMAAAMVDGVYQDIAEVLKPGVKESEIVELATARLYAMGSDCVEAINAISGERCSPHPHNFTDRLIRPGDQAFFDIIQSYMGYRTCYYRTFNVGLATAPQRTAYRKAREWMDRAIDLLKPGVSSDRIAASFPTGQGDRLCRGDGRVRPQFLPRLGPRPARAAAGLAPELAQGTDRAQGGHGVRRGNLLSRERRLLGGADRGRGDPHARGPEGDLALSGAGAADRKSLLILATRPFGNGNL